MIISYLKLNFITEDYSFNKLTKIRNNLNYIEVNFTIKVYV